MRNRYYADGIEVNLAKIKPVEPKDIDVSGMRKIHRHTPIPYSGGSSLDDLLEFLNEYKDDPEVYQFEIDTDDDSYRSESILSLIRNTEESTHDFNLRKREAQVKIFNAWKQYQIEINNVKLTPTEKKMARLKALAKELGVNIKQ